MRCWPPRGRRSPLPRTSRERVLHLQVLLLTAEQGSSSTSWRTPGIWSRAALQGDMTEVRERLAHFAYHDSKPRVMHCGSEMAIRACSPNWLLPGAAAPASA